MIYQPGFSVRYSFKTSEVGIVVPFSLGSNGLEVFGEARVDTGSEYCLFQREIADELQIEVEDGFLVRLSTLIGNFTAYAHTVNLNVLGIRFESTVLFTPAYGTTRNLLGRAGWLNNLHLALTMDDEMIYLNPAYSQENL